VSPHPLEAIKNQGPVALSFFIFTSLYSTPPNDGKTSSPTRSALLHRLSNVPPSTEIIVRWVVAFLHRIAATQDRCSVHLSIFCWVPLGRPNQAIPPQRAQARAPGACNGLTGSRGAAIRAHGGWFHGEGGRSRGGSGGRLNLSLCLCMLRDGEYSSTLRSTGSTLPSAGSTYANLGYMSTRLSVHVYMSTCYTGAYFWVIICVQVASAHVYM
jgi:hypothetical protein